MGAFVSLGISNALRPLSDVDRGAYYALAAVALFLSTMILSYLEKVHVRHDTLGTHDTRTPTHAVTLSSLIFPLSIPASATGMA